MICLNREYSTTRNLQRIVPVQSEIPSSPLPQKSGGLGTRGFHKTDLERKPLLSVIIPVLNRAHCIEQCLKSVINQRYDNIEVIVVDGGSTDATVEIIKQYEDRIDLWISEADKGVYDAMNKGIVHARGSWIYFLGSDDMLIDVVHRVAEHLTDPHHIYHGDIYRVAKHRLYGGKACARDMIRGNIPHQALFYPREVFTRYRYDQRYRIVADHHLNLLCLSDSTFRFVHIPLLIAIFNDLEGLSSTARDVAFEKDLPSLIRDRFGSRLYWQYLVRRSFGSFEKNYLRKVFRFFRPQRKELPS